MRLQTTYTAQRAAARAADECSQTALPPVLSRTRATADRCALWRRRLGLLAVYRRLTHGPQSSQRRWRSTERRLDAQLNSFRACPAALYFLTSCRQHGSRICARAAATTRRTMSGPHSCPRQLCAAQRLRHRGDSRLDNRELSAWPGTRQPPGVHSGARRYLVPWLAQTHAFRTSSHFRARPSMFDAFRARGLDILDLVVPLATPGQQPDMLAAA
jgi:hypothetical protein